MSNTSPFASRVAGVATTVVFEIAAIALPASVFAAHSGKLIFLAFIAQNALASRVWYVVWFVVSGCTGARVLAAIISRFLRR